VPRSVNDRLLRLLADTRWCSLAAHKEFLTRRDESFRRVTCKCLAELFSEYEDGGSASPTEPEMVARMVKGSDGSFQMERVPAADADGNNSEHCSTARSSAGPRIVSYEADEKEDYDPPYLILDTRPREEFAVNRIHRAKSFPAAYLCRDYLLPEMHQFVRAPLRL
jgi:centrosomal protein CEP41